MSKQSYKYHRNHHKILPPKPAWQIILTTHRQTVQSLQVKLDREPQLWGSVVEPTNWATLGTKGVQVLSFTRGTSGWSDIYEGLFERPAMELQDKTERLSPSESVVKHSSQQHHPLTYFWSRCG